MLPPIFYDIRIFEMFFVSFKIFFAHFVRNRLFSNKPFTDRRPIFIDVSVTGSDFDKCNACSIVAHTQKKPDDLQWL